MIEHGSCFCGMAFYDVQRLFVAESSGFSFLCPLFMWACVLDGQPGQPFDGFNLAKKVFIGERRVNTTGTWTPGLLQEMQQKSRPLLSGGSLLWPWFALAKQTKLSLDIILAQKEFEAFNCP